MRFRVIGRKEQAQTEVVRDVVCDTREDAEAFAVWEGIQIERIETLADSLAPAESAEGSSRPGAFASSADPGGEEWATEFDSVLNVGTEDRLPYSQFDNVFPPGFGSAPAAALPAPLDDPLRACRWF